MTKTTAAEAPDPRPRRTSAAPTHPEVATEVLRQFRLVFNAVKAHFRQVERDVGLGGAQVWALSVVREQPGIGITGLAQALDIRQSTASNLVRQLVERGLVEARRPGEDRRTVQLRLRPEGGRLLRKAPAPLAGVLPDALESLDMATLKRLRSDLKVLLTRLHADRRAAKTPLADL